MSKNSTKAAAILKTTQQPGSIIVTSFRPTWIGGKRKWPYKPCGPNKNESRREVRDESVLRLASTIIKRGPNALKKIEQVEIQWERTTEKSTRAYESFRPNENIHVLHKFLILTKIDGLQNMILDYGINFITTKKETWLRFALHTLKPKSEIWIWFEFWFKPVTCQTRTIPHESTAQQLSYEWSHTRVSSTDSKVRTTLYSIINSTTWMYSSIAFIWMVTH